MVNSLSPVGISLHFSSSEELDYSRYIDSLACEVKSAGSKVEAGENT